MARIKKKREGGYTTISNELIRNKNLSLKAIGLFAVLWSLPEDWDFSIHGMCSILKDGESSIRSAITELKDNGLLTVSRERKNGKLGKAIWILQEKPNVENHHEVKHHEGIPTQLNKELINKDIQNKEEDNLFIVDSCESPQKQNKHSARFVKPAIEEIRSYCFERCNTVDAERFYDYYESNGWMVGKNKMKDWKAAVRTWERSSYGSGGQGTPNTYHKETVGEHNMRVLAEYRKKKMEMMKGEQ